MGGVINESDFFQANFGCTVMSETVTDGGTQS